MVIHSKFTQIFLAFFIVCFYYLPSFAKTEVRDLKCEYLVDPVGIDVTQPRLSWKIVSTESNVLQTAYEIRVAATLQALEGSANLLWNCGKVNSNQSVNVDYNGQVLSPMQRVFWQVRVWTGKGKPTQWSAPAFWETGLLDYQNWKADWITSPFDKPDEPFRLCSYFRKDFLVSKKVKSARIYASALGLYELYLNGKKVGDQLFTPGWTSYKKRIQYQTYDVTELLSVQNSIGALLGDGWYRGTLGGDGNRNYYGEQTALIAQLQLNYTDGTSEVISTNETWKSSTGAILFSDFYNGEIQDARYEQPGWNNCVFNDAAWRNAVIYNYPKNILFAQQGVPVKAIQEIHPVKLFQTTRGETVFDMGQNMVGWVRLNVNGKSGQKIKLRFAEVLDKQGNFYTENLRTAIATDLFILKGGGEEVVEPHFTYHGFRYVRVEGFPGNSDLNSITGVVIHSDMRPTGNFSCSDSLINQLQHNIQWSQKGNFFDVPTDCPQRDERLGWTGDAQVYCATATFNFNVAPFFTKWLGDLAVDQSLNGSVPDVIPDVTMGGGSAAWADAAVIVPWNLYLAYGDKQILERQYPSMKALVDYMQKRAGKDYIWDGDPQFGDWQALVPSYVENPDLITNKDLIATAYYCYTTRLFAKIASVLGKTDDAESYSKLAGKIKMAFSLAFVDPSGRLTSDTQTAYLLATGFDLLPPKSLKRAVDYLASYIESVGHLTTGFVGTPLLCKTLSDNGHADLAFKLLMRKEYPSWLYPVTQGATTIWERWDGIKPDGTFQNPAMNSFNHYSYGSIGEWLYQYIAGLNPDEIYPGYRHIILSPHPGGGLTCAKAEFESMYGKIVSGWTLENGKMVYQAEIPTNTTASFISPFLKTGKIQINGKSSNLETGNRIELGSGSYLITFDYNYQ
jgi:alpha-L-rhamnosidase